MTQIENRAVWSVHREAVTAAKARGACYACQQHAGFRAVEAAGLSQPTLDLHTCKNQKCNERKDRT